MIKQLIELTDHNGQALFVDAYEVAALLNSSDGSTKTVMLMCGMEQNILLDGVASENAKTLNESMEEQGGM